jgi:predicted ATPase/class 3 adenylate cyclase/GAF domain-containing protein
MAQPQDCSASLQLENYEISRQIHRSRFCHLFSARHLQDGTEVVVKTLKGDFPSRKNVAKLRREHQIIDRLQTVDRVIRTLGCQSWGNGNLALILEPYGHSLSAELSAAAGNKLSLERFLHLAIAISEAVGQIHECDIVHKGIWPGNILVRDDNIKLIDFTLSSELKQERFTHTVGNGLEGILAYMSPEQTGRMNRDIDYRSDLYSLGITFYTMLTGSNPFRASSLLEWVHSHIGVSPIAPHETNQAVPNTLSEIICKLLEKNAEDRYQSCYGLAADLRRCQLELKRLGEVSRFTPGKNDVSRKFLVPQKLYGREQELSLLLSRLEHINQGRLEICMVSGYSGVGKTSLINELTRNVSLQRGILIHGKYDQFQRSKPYSAIANALQELSRQLLAGPGKSVLAWRDRLQKALGPNGQIMVDLVPGLEQLIGRQPQVPSLSSNEALARLQIVWLKFIQAISEEVPLVLFLDDLQYSDSSSLQLIRWLGSATHLSRFLLIGAYRSNEVDTGHPLQLALNDIGKYHPVSTLHLQPLDNGSVRNLVAESLQVDPKHGEVVADYLDSMAQGNPFFLIEMMHTLAQKQAIRFNPVQGEWQWDLDLIRSAGLTGNVVDFLVSNMRLLPKQTQRVLQLASCIGDTFDLYTLSVIYEQSMDETGEALLPSLRQRLIVPLHDDYTLVGKPKGAAIPSSERQGVNPTYRFQHDRVQQAAYALIDPAHKQLLHLSIGRLLQAKDNKKERDEHLIEIVNHLNHGRSLIEDQDEKFTLASLNLVAGIRAKNSSAYESAIEYLRIGQELLPKNCWQNMYELSLKLGFEYQQCAYLTGRYEEADSWVEILLQRSKTNLEKAEVLSLRTRQYATTGRMKESIRSAIQGLKLLGYRLVEAPSIASIRRMQAKVKKHLGDRTVASLVDGQPLTDPHRIVAIRLLMEIFPAAFLSGSGNLFPYLVLKSVSIALEYGNSPETAFAYSAYGMLLCGVLDDHALGHEFGKLGVELNQRLNDLTLRARIIYVYAMFIHHWSEHWSSMTPWFMKGIEAGYQSGDLLYLAYSAQDCIIWDPTIDLEEAEQEHAKFMKIVQNCEYQDSLDSGNLFLQMQRAMLGRTNNPYTLNDFQFDEDECLHGMKTRGFMTGVANYHIYKAEINFMHGSPQTALSHIQAQDSLVASSMSLPQLVRYYCIAFLVRAACLSQLSGEEQIGEKMLMRQHRQNMLRLANHCPTNFLHHLQVMDAEMARLEGRTTTAWKLYDLAIATAKYNGFRRDEAVANELAARNLLSTGKKKAAIGYLQAAIQIYRSWGAHCKVSLLAREFPELFDAAQLQTSGNFSHEIQHQTVDIALSSLDLASIMKASQAISGEIVLSHLWQTTMRIMLENAGGQWGVFVIRREEKLILEGHCQIDASGRPTILELTPEISADSEQLPTTIIYQVLNTNKPIILSDATQCRFYAHDLYIQIHQPRSVLCIPLLRQGRFEGAVYMENNLAAGVFSAERIELLRLLAAQASISIENAHLYEDQLNLIKAQHRFVPSPFLQNLGQSDITGVKHGQHRATTMHIMFSDLRGFAPLAEHLPPQELFEILNRYFATMDSAITEMGGFIDSFAGDEIKALFDQPADCVVEAAISMCRALEAINQESSKSGLPQLRHGVGINTGSVLLGTVGSKSRLQCSVIGDAVILSSRIEQLTKYYDANVLLGEVTYRSLHTPAAFSLRRIDRVAVKGKRQAVDLYELLDAESPKRKACKLATREHLDQGMRLYLDRDFEAAQSIFDEMHRLDPCDQVPSLLRARCERYRLNPPPAEWEGCEQLHQK